MKAKSTQSLMLMAIALLSAWAGPGIAQTMPSPSSAAPAPATVDPFAIAQVAAEPAVAPPHDAPADAVSPLALSLREVAPGATAPDAARQNSTFVMVGGSLTFVIGLFLLVAWVFRRHAPTGSQQLPRDVFEVLGRAAFPGRQQVHLVRCGAKLLLVHVTPTGAETLTEVNDPAEVARLCELCRPGSATSLARPHERRLGEYGDTLDAAHLARLGSQARGRRPFVGHALGEGVDV